MTSNFAGNVYRPGNVGSEWLRSAAGAVRNRWIVLLVGAVVGGLLGWGLTATETPDYESSAVIYQTPHFGDTDGTSRQRTEAYTELLTSDLLIDTALADSGVDMSPSELRKKTTASANVGSAILTVTVRTDDAAVSAKLANALAEALPGIVSTLDGTIEVPNPTSDEPELVVADPVRLSVITPALAEDAEGGPKYARNIALGVIAGLLAGLLYAYLRSQLNRKVQNTAALGKFLSGPVLASIPADKALESGLVDFLRDTPAAEAFRRLRTVIADREPGQGECRTIVVSSAVDGDGKTAVALNLAVALAEAGNEVVFVDAAVTGEPDERSGQHASRSEDDPTSAGLTGYLLGEGNIDRYLAPSWHSRLAIVPGGVAVTGQSELLGTTRMRSGLEDLAARANYVIVDTASLSTRSDALVLGRWAAGVLLVARCDHTRYAELGGAVDRLLLAEVPVCGVVLNDFPRPLLRSRRKSRERLSAAELLAPGARRVRTAG